MLRLYSVVLILYISGTNTINFLFTFCILTTEKSKQLIILSYFLILIFGGDVSGCFISVFHAVSRRFTTMFQAVSMSFTITFAAVSRCLTALLHAGSRYFKEFHCCVSCCFKVFHGSVS